MPQKSVNTRTREVQSKADAHCKSHNELPPTKTNVGSKEFSSNEINGSRESNKRRREERLNSKLQVSHTTISGHTSSPSGTTQVGDTHQTIVGTGPFLEESENEDAEKEHPPKKQRVEAPSVVEFSPIDDSTGHPRKSLTTSGDGESDEDATADVEDVADITPANTTREDADEDVNLPLFVRQRSPSPPLSIADFALSLARATFARGTVKNGDNLYCTDQCNEIVELLCNKGQENLITPVLKAVAEKAKEEAKKLDNQPVQFVEGGENNIKYFDAIYEYIDAYVRMKFLRGPTDLKFRAYNRDTKKWRLVKNFNDLSMKEKDQIAEGYISCIQQKYRDSARPWFFNLHTHNGSEKIWYPKVQMMPELNTKRSKNKQLAYHLIKTDEENRI